ncbi:MULTISPECIES: recombination regulator RecX [Streptomyces]|uniref:recombination regulator RecX n=1 Tax=Streptomyces TaxID=1883 RepID=UPI001F24D02C|nr:MULTISPECIES: recombination regulator RecX [Streptomyces]
MTQYDTVGGGPAGPEDEDYGPPDWFAAVAEEPESDRAPARAVRGAAPGPAQECEQPAEVSVEALGLVSASELPTGRRRRRSAVTAEEFEAGVPASAPAFASRRRSEDGAAGHGGVAASTPRSGARRGRTRRGRTADGLSGEGLSGEGLFGDEQRGEDLSGERKKGARGARKQAEESADPETSARDVCLRLLTGAAKTRKQLADALRKREIPDEVADEVLTRLEEVGLIDDAAFAEAWVESRHAVRGLSRRALAQELRTKGVAADLVEQAVSQLDHDDEADAARALVERKLRSTRGLDPQVRTRRLVGMLARRGYSEGLAFRVVRAALEEEGSELSETEGE